MTEEQKKKIQNRILYISIAIIALLVVCMVFLGVTHRADTIWFPVVSAVFLIAYWTISNVLSMVWLRSFEDKTEDQKKAYFIYAAVDFVGLGGLVYFLADMQSMNGVFIYVICTFLKRKFYTDFVGAEEEETKEPAEGIQAPDSVDDADTDNGDEGGGDIDNREPDHGSQAGRGED